MGEGGTGGAPDCKAASYRETRILIDIEEMVAIAHIVQNLHL